GGDKPFHRAPRPEGKPFVRHTERGGGAGGERTARRFDRPSDGGFEKRERPEGFKRTEGGAKPCSRPSEVEEVPGERIAKRLARVGIASRRDAEELIAAGRIRVNGKVLESPAFNVMH